MQYLQFLLLVLSSSPASATPAALYQEPHPGISGGDPTLPIQDSPTIVRSPPLTPLIRGTTITSPSSYRAIGQPRSQRRSEARFRLLKRRQRHDCG